MSLVKIKLYCIILLTAPLNYYRTCPNIRSPPPPEASHTQFSPLFAETTGT